MIKFICFFLCFLTVSATAGNSLSVVGPDILTFEHSDRSTYLFYDYDHRDKSGYGELVVEPFHFNSSVSTVCSVEYGSLPPEFLWGLSFNLKPSWLNYLNLQLLQRQNRETQQVTLVWGKSFKRFVIDGYVDRVNESIRADTQIKYEVSPGVFIGTEVSWNRNKYGIKGNDETRWDFLVRSEF